MSGALETLLTLSWQVAVLVLLIAIVQRVFGRWLSPSWRHGLWWLVAVRLLLPVLPASEFSLFSLVPGETPAPETVATTAPPAPLAPLTYVPPRVPREPVVEPAAVPKSPAVEADVPPIAPDTGAVATTSAETAHLWLFLWLGGAVLLLLVTAMREIRFMARLRRGKPVADPAILALVAECAAELGLRPPVAVHPTDVAVPAVAGIFRPRLLLPEAVVGSLTVARLRHVVLHELEHVRRRDALANWLLHLLACAHWFNPFVWFAFGRLRTEREAVRDLAVIRRQPGSGREYGRTILDLANGARRSRPALVAILEKNRDVKRRITMIARFADRRSRGLILGLPLVLLLAMTTFTGAGEEEKEQPVDPELKRLSDLKYVGGNHFEEAVREEAALAKIRVERQDPAPEWRAKLETKLMQPVSIRFDAVPLPEAVRMLAKAAKAPIVMTEGARDYAEDIEITLDFTEKRLDQILGMLAVPYNYGFVVSEGAIVVAELGDLPFVPDQRIYNLSPLLAQWPEKDRLMRLEEILGELSELISTFVAPESWDYAEMQSWGDLLVVRQDDTGHRLLEAFLNGLLNEGRGLKAPPPPWKVELNRALAQELTLNLEELDAREIAAKIHEILKVPISVHGDYADNSEIESLVCEKTPAREVLATLARRMDAFVDLRDGGVYIGNYPPFVIRMYPVTDLLREEAVTESQPGALIELVRRSVRPDSWDEAPVGYWNGLLVVAQAESCHREIERFFGALRRAMKQGK